MRKFLIIMLIVVACNQRQASKGVYDDKISNEVTICTQNLHNFGDIKSVKTRTKQATQNNINEQLDSLVNRFTKQDCDLIAVQEVLGDSIKAAERALNFLTRSFSAKTNKNYLAQIGYTNDRISYPGVIYNNDKFKLKKSYSYKREYLPKLEKNDPPAMFARAPLRVDFVSRYNEQIISLINFHLKSKSKRSRIDYSGYEWEHTRMRSAEALRAIVLETDNNLSKASDLVFVLGDRNSEPESASAQILEGKLNLKDFNNNCDLSKNGNTKCNKLKKAELKSIFRSLSAKKIGTMRYKSNYESIDDILVTTQDFNFLKQLPVKSGVNFLNDYKASDHGLVWTKFIL